MQTAITQILENSLTFHYYRGDSTQTAINDALHSHPFMVVGQIVDGGLKSYSEQNGNMLIRDGESYCMPADTNIRSKSINNSAATFHWAHINYFICNGIHLSRLLALPTVIKAPKSKRIGSINQRLAALQHETPCMQHIIERKQLGMELLGCLIGDQDVELDQQRLQSFMRMQPILEHMHDHLADPLQVKHIASLFKLSLSRFHELFTEATGSSPGQFQLQLRLQHAQMLLASSNMPIKDIAESIGFEDNHYFSRIFKKRYAITPSAFRNQGYAFDSFM